MCDFDVALSFAGEDRDIVESFYLGLKDKGVKVFYDKNQTADLWGKDLYQHLNSIYKEKSKYAIIFISKNYALKSWAKHELKAAQSRAFVDQNREYILPIKLDDTILPGIDDTCGFINFRAYSNPCETIIDLFIQKLKKQFPDRFPENKIQQKSLAEQPVPIMLGVGAAIAGLAGVGSGNKDITLNTLIQNESDDMFNMLD